MLLAVLFVLIGGAASITTESPSNSTGGNSIAGSSNSGSSSLPPPEEGSFIMHTWLGRGVRGTRVAEEFVARPSHGRIVRGLLYECSVRNLSATVQVNGVDIPAEKAWVEKLKNGYSQLIIEPPASAIRTSNSTGWLGEPIWTKIEYNLRDSIVPVHGSSEFAVFFGLPPCSLSLCPRLSKTQVDVIVPGKVTSVSSLLHCPGDMFYDLPLSGLPQAPPPRSSFTVHSVQGFFVSRIQLLPPFHQTVMKDRQEISDGESLEDVIAFVARFVVQDMEFHTGTDLCYPSQFVSDLLDNGVNSQGANMMLHIGLVIVAVCAGIPCLIGAGFWVWIRLVQKKKAPRTPRGGIASFSYGTGPQSFYEIVNEDNETTIDKRSAPPPSSSRNARYSL